MELPRGVLVRSFKGPIPFQELDAALQKDFFTGFIRASLLKGTFVESVLIYEAGKPIISLMSDGKTDRPDNEQSSIASIAASEDAAMELFSLNRGQINLVMDFCKEYIIMRPLPPPPQAPPVKEIPRPMPVQKLKAPREEKPLDLPEVRGTFIKSENTDDLRSYVEGRKDETGHVILIKQDGANNAEYHLLFLRGKIVAAYSPSNLGGAAGYGTALLGQLMAMRGTVEFYHVDEPIIHSILKMYPHVGVSLEDTPLPAPQPVPQPRQEPVPARAEPGPMEILRPDGRSYGMPPSPATKSQVQPIANAAHGPVIRPPAIKAVSPPDTPKHFDTIKSEAPAKQGIGIPARSLFEKTDRQSYNVEGGLGMPAPESRSTGTLKGDMDDDADFVKKVEKEFVGNVDDLLKRLELSHLKVVPERKKR